MWKQIIKVTTLLSVAIAIAACGNRAPETPAASLAIPTVDVAAVPTLNAQQVSLGKTVYDQNCAACHGVNGEGQPNWKTTNADGSLPAPPHDATGHTWHHADEQLLNIITNGEKDIFPQSQMPAFGSQLSSYEISAVLAYIKSWWGAEERGYQWQITEQTGD